ncbi:MAG: hypothetical protein PHT02_01240 [Tissierellia bacterium]|nr:hypothetical protein [Tissierellia bacterium]
MKVKNYDCPDYIEKDSNFTIGEKIIVEYDWSDKESCMNGYKNTWHKDKALFTVSDIFCNMLIMRNEIMIQLSSEDKLFIKRCNCTKFEVFENLLKERICY